MLKILIVDDEQIVRVYLQSIVNWEQYDCQVVTTCENGMEALEVIGQQPIDLILTDLKMPKMDGLKLIEEIKIRGYHTKVIVLSSQNDYNLVCEAMKLGALDCYVKIDVKEEDIISMIEHVSREMKKQLLENFTIKRKNFITSLLTENRYDDKSELLHGAKLYHLFEPQLSLYRLRFQHPIESSQFSYVTTVIESKLKKYDHNVILLTQEMMLVILYEQAINKDQVGLSTLN